MAEGTPGAPRPTRTTRQGQAVLRALTASASFRSAQDIHAELRGAGEQVGLATVYRHLQLLSEEGVIDALQSGDGEVVYRRCRSGDHHHHLVCRSCGRSAEVEAPAVEAWAERVAAAAGFSEVSHTVEVFGVCPDCTAAAGSR